MANPDAGQGAVRDAGALGKAYGRLLGALGLPATVDECHQREAGEPLRDRHVRDLVIQPKVKSLSDLPLFPCIVSE